MGKLVTGFLSEIERDPERKKTFKGVDRVVDCVRFVFQIEGCKFPHKSGWLTFNYSEKSALFTKYLTSLVEGAKPNMDFDIEQLKGMKVNMLWKENPKDPQFQVIEAILPAESKLIPINNFVTDETNKEPDETPF